jgi:predicted ATPase
VTSESDYDPSRVEARRDQFILISGCSGSGKSSLLAELARRGYRTFEEPGRQIVKEQLSIGGDALPWENVLKFVDHAIVRSMHNMILAARDNRLAFFDRGIIDAVVGLERANMPVPPHYGAALEKYRYNRKVFVSPPWSEIFCNDSERRHSFADAVDECEALESALPRLGYEVVRLPQASVAARADFVMAALGR